MHSRKKTAVSLIFLYLLLTAGIWTYLYACSNSYNRIYADKVSPARLILEDNCARLHLMQYELDIPLDTVSADTPAAGLLYLITPDELRAAAAMLLNGSGVGTCSL